MSDKSARVNSYRAEEYERKVIQKLKSITDRPIIYRPKPSWGGARPIDGVIYSSPAQKLSEVLPKCWAVVTHHSNVAIDALVSGVPVFVGDKDCAAGQLAKVDLNEIENPYYPSQEERLKLLNNLAFCQWMPVEMRRGLPWRYFKEIGVL